MHNVTNTCFRKLGFVLKNSGDFRTNDAAPKLVYKSCVPSKIEYAALIWSPSYYVVHINALERIQRYFLKYLIFRQDNVYPAIGVRSVSIKGLFDRFDVQLLEERRHSNVAIFRYKLIHNMFNWSQILEILPFHIIKACISVFRVGYTTTCEHS